MAQAVAEHVQAAEQYAEEEGVGGPQPLEALAVRGGSPGAGARGPARRRLAAPDAGCAPLPRRSWACQPPT